MKPGVLIDSGIDHDASLGAMSLGKIVARIERLKSNGMHVRARLLIGLATFFDGFDVIVIAATLPLLIARLCMYSTSTVIPNFQRRRGYKTTRLGCV